MAIDVFKTLDIIEVMENYLETVRPPEEMRKQIDLGYHIENQSVILTEIRPVWSKPGEYAGYEYAKASFIKSKNAWKIFWMRGNLQWHPYDPMPEVATLKDFLRIVDEDKHRCFKG